MCLPPSFGWMGAVGEDYMYVVVKELSYVVGKENRIANGESCRAFE